MHQALSYRNAAITHEFNISVIIARDATMRAYLEVSDAPLRRPPRRALTVTYAARAACGGAAVRHGHGNGSLAPSQPWSPLEILGNGTRTTITCMERSSFSDDANECDVTIAGTLEACLWGLTAFMGVHHVCAVPASIWPAGSGRVAEGSALLTSALRVMLRTCACVASPPPPCAMVPGTARHPAARGRSQGRDCQPL